MISKSKVIFNIYDILSPKLTLTKTYKIIL